MAQIYERINQPREAAKKHLAVAEIHFGRKEMAPALENWERAIQLDGDQAQAYMRLAVIYEKNKQTVRQAIAAYIALARLFQHGNHPDRAEQALQRAQAVDPTNQDARAALSNLKQGIPIDPIDTSIFNVSAQLAAMTHKQDVPVPAEEEGMVWDEGVGVAGRTPADEAAHYAMGLLSDMVFEGQIPGAALAPLVQAIELHQVGDAEGAIEMYTQAMKAGVNHDALRFNLGLLYQFAHRPAEAIDILEKATATPEYVLAANQTLGQVYLAEGEIRQAARHMVTALREADLRVNGSVDEEGYERVRAGLTEQPLEYLTDLSRGINKYLDDPRWETKLRSTRQGYEAQGKTSYVRDLVELVMEGGRPELAQIMERVDFYMERSLLKLAMDEAQYAIEKSPDYLPAHRRMADILVRENAERAADLFAEVLTIWPTDMIARERVLEMLTQQGRVNEALKHYAEMADQYYRIRFDQARAVEIYQEALRYADKNRAAPEHVVRILKALADIESQQLNWDEAVKYLRRCKELLPDDEDVATALVDLNFQTGNVVHAIAALDEYMRYCVEHGYVDRVISTLEKQVRMRGTEVALRQRLASVYRQQGRTAEAIAQMDAIGEMLLEQGRIDQAIQELIQMNPSDKVGYEQLLAQLQR